MMRKYTLTKLTDTAAQCHKARESLQALLVQLWESRSNDISLARKEAEKVSDIITYPHTLPTSMALGGFKVLPYILSCREVRRIYLDT